MVTKLFNSAKFFIQRENKPLLIIFDEAEAMVGSRKDAGNGEGAQENIAIVNAILRGIDQLSIENCPAAVIFISNTPLRIDEALMRRCTHYSFPIY
jgi:SpoVK/Ycf46/Vps4 family AAA+-type ATPase